MTNLRDIRRATAYDLDDMIVASALAGATFNTVGMFFVASTETNLSASRYDGRYLYHCPASLTNGQQRRVSKGSYVPTTGFVTVQPGMAVPSVNDAIELTALLPCDSPPFGADTSYRSMINDALRKLLIGDRVTLPIATSQVYTLPTWLSREDRLLRVFEPAPFGDAPVDAAWRRPRFVSDGAANLLIFDVPFSTASGVLSMDVRRPAISLIAPTATGTLGDSTVGLVNDGDQISPQLELVEVKEVAKAGIYEMLANRGDDPRWRKAWVAQLQIARGQPHYDRGGESAAAQAVPDQQKQAA